MQERSSNRLPEERQAARAVGVLIDTLNRAGVRYCHWKSNARLADALRGESDLDLLVARADAARFQAVIGSLGYKPCVSDTGPSICHYYGLDEESGRLVHVHAYYRILTGGTVLKNYRLPLEEMLLRGTRQIQGVFVPDRAAELVSFVVRKTLEHAALIEAVFLAREGSLVVEELDWLSQGVSEDEISRLLREYLPSVDLEFFRNCREAIARGSAVRRFLLARELSFRLRHHLRYRRAHASVIRSSRCLAGLARRVVRRGPTRVLLSGGAVVAVVGSDGAGKSTVVGDLTGWLGTSFRVRRIHAGKPPAAVTTAGLRVLLPLMRRLAPRYRKTSVEMKGAGGGGHGVQALRSGRLFFLYAVRAVAVAHERRHLLVRALRKAAGGTLIVSDRYPTPQAGAPDSPGLSFLLRDANPLYAWLARLEERAYRAMPPPDLVIYLEVPVDLACHRNLTREKAGAPKPTDVIRRRHAQTAELDFPGSPVHRVSTDTDLEITLRRVREIVWKAL
jgi:thymidylate kinase